MKPFLIFLSFALLVGCAANQSKQGIFKHLSDRDTVPLQMALEAGEDVNQVDAQGRTLLHHAIRHAPHLVEVIIKANPDVNIQDRDGFTPLHVSVIDNPAFIPALLLMGADATVKSTGKIFCRVGTQRKVVVAKTPLEMAEVCKRSESLTEFNRFAADTEAWAKAKQSDQIGDYENYLKRFAKPLFARSAHEAIKRVRAEWIVTMQEKSQCELQVAGWYFIEGTCKNNLAHGNGVAVTIDNERFVGQFENGWRVKGAYSQSDEITYDGEFEQGQPHGYGICRYDGQMEECRLYQGERIDTLYKQREDMRKQFERLSGQMEQLRGTVAASARSSDSGKSRYGYIADLASDDGATRTAAQVQAALDIFRVLVEASN